MKLSSVLLCLLFALCANLIIPAAKAQVNVNDSLALVDLYNSTNGPNWRFNNNWLTKNPVSTWEDVEVTNNRVTALFLENNLLTGTIPPSIGNLTQLTYIDFSENQLSGAIPKEIGNLQLLYLMWLNDNQLSGAIPASFTNLQQLQYVFLYNNQLTGSLPASIGNLKSLQVVRFNNNQFTGAIPASIGNLNNLFILHLDGNKLSGTIPSAIGNLTAMTEMGFSNNQLSGAIPASISKLQKLETLSLGNNQLTGIPHTLIQLKQLRALSLDNNRFSGAIPPELGLLGVEFLSLAHNQFTGSTPYSFTRFRNIDYLDISYNLLGDRSMNFYLPDSNPESRIYMNNNRCTFDQAEYAEQIRSHIFYLLYAPQANITIHHHGNSLAVYAGGTLSNNTYIWHRIGGKGTITIHGDSTLTPAESGRYFVTVTNSVATQLTLYSDTAQFILPAAAQNSIATAATAMHTGNSFSIYPTPASNIVHVRVTGTADIVLTNSDGKTILTKTINNNDVINVSKYSGGTYYLQNKTTGEVQKIVLAH